jgi:hypothetical protein
VLALWLLYKNAQGGGGGHPVPLYAQPFGREDKKARLRENILYILQLEATGVTYIIASEFSLLRIIHTI